LFGSGRCASTEQMRWVLSAPGPPLGETRSPCALLVRPARRRGRHHHRGKRVPPPDADRGRPHGRLPAGAGAQGREEPGSPRSRRRRSRLRHFRGRGARWAMARAGAHPRVGGVRLALHGGPGGQRIRSRRPPRRFLTTSRSSLEKRLGQSHRCGEFRGGEALSERRVSSTPIASHRRPRT